MWKGNISDIRTIHEVREIYRPVLILEDLPYISCSADANRLMRQFLDAQPELDISLQEYFFAIYLNRRNRILGIRKISEGGTSGTVVDAKMLFRACLKYNPSGIVLVHNHPSGNTTPSETDKRLTKVLKEAGKALDIPIIDHLILGGDTYLSFNDEGL